MDGISEARLVEVLQSGTMEIEGILPWSSNYTFLARVCVDDIELPAVYKPRRGERPLWDFPQGTLSLRERAAFLVSEELGWRLVPSTVLRRGEHGPGSVQLFVDHDPDLNYFSLEDDQRYRSALQKMALFDAVVNNADRKGGHVIVEHGAGDDEPHLWGIDHGICFHAEYKLRTVIWEFAGDAIPSEMQQEMQGLSNQLLNSRSRIRGELANLLSEREIGALCARTRRLAESGKFPTPGPGRHYPWPPV